MSRGVNTAHDPSRQPQPPGGASASGLMRLSGIGQFDQGAPAPPPERSWGTPLDPTHGATPGWDPGEAWPTYYQTGMEWRPQTNFPGQYSNTRDLSEISVGTGSDRAPTPTQESLYDTSITNNASWSGSVSGEPPPPGMPPSEQRYTRYGSFPSQMTRIINMTQWEST